MVRSWIIPVQRLLDQLHLALTRTTPYTATMEHYTTTFSESRPFPLAFAFIECLQNEANEVHYYPCSSYAVFFEFLQSVHYLMADATPRMALSKRSAQERLPELLIDQFR